MALPGLMMAMDHGAVEMSYAGTTANLKSADVLLTPDFRILIGGPGAADVKVRLGQQGRHLRGQLRRQRSLCGGLKRF